MSTATPASPAVPRSKPAEPATATATEENKVEMRDESWGFAGTLIRVVCLLAVFYTAYTIRLHAVNVYGRVIHEVPTPRPCLLSF